MKLDQLSDTFLSGSRPHLRLLSGRQIQQLHYASLDILERTGVVIRLPEALQLLQDAGATISAGDRVRIPSHMVETALAAAPGRITISDRNGRPAMHLEGYNSHYGPGPTIQFVYDVYSGKRRATDREDIEKAALICDYLPNIDFVMTMGMTGGIDPAAKGLPAQLTDRLDFEAMLTHTTKPLIFSSWTLAGLTDIYEMAAAVSGSAQRLREFPFIIAFTQPNTPLEHNPEPLEFLLFCARKGVPVIYSGAPLMGGTAPVTLAGSFVLSNAEFLSALVIAQLMRKGAPVIYGAGFGPLDMRAGTSPYNGPECYLSKIMAKEMSTFYGLPDWSYGGLTDAKLLDQQAALEAGLTLFQATQVGSSLIHDIGYMETGMTACWELMVLADEIIDALKYYLKGVDINADTLALELIDRVGPGGNFLSEAHTFEHFKKIWYPKVIDHQDYENWTRQGAQPLGQVLNTKVRSILENHQPEPLSPTIREQIKAVLDRAARSYRC